MNKMGSNFLCFFQAMNLIAAGKLDAGVELLCLVDCHLDACYYLQSESQWRRAALLAKATLHYAAYSEVLNRWVDHLATSQKKVRAVKDCACECTRNAYLSNCAHVLQCTPAIFLSFFLPAFLVSKCCLKLWCVCVGAGLHCRRTLFWCALRLAGG